MPIPVRRGWGREDLLVVPKGFKLAAGRQEKLQLHAFPTPLAVVMAGSKPPKSGADAVLYQRPAD